MTRIEMNLIADIQEHTAMKFSGLLDVAKKTGEEVVELGEALGSQDVRRIIEEASDVAILAWDILLKCGVTQPMRVMAVKMDILEERRSYRGRSGIDFKRV